MSRIITYQDGTHTLFLSTKGRNDDFSDAYVARLQESIRRIKRDREMGARYMLFEELLKDEHKAGKAEGIAIGKAESVLDALEEKGIVSEEIRTRILAEKNLDTLKAWLKIAVKAETPEQFLEATKLD